eukprot:c24944_g5_i4 orf=591-1457(+)
MSWTFAMDLGKEHLPKLVSTGLSSVSRDSSKGTRKRPLQCLRKNEADEDGLTEKEKKRRLTMEQVNFLETSFNMDLKLEPERKALIAKQLGLRPRQVAIWFQNRRARWKNKQVEQEYESLKASYDTVVKEKKSLAEEYDLALEGNKRLQAEVARLTSLVQSLKEKEVTDIQSTPTKKEEQKRVKSELMSPAKSAADEQSEIEDVVMPLEAAEVATTDQSDEMLNSVSGVRLEGECPPLLSSDSVFASLPFIVQQLVANGYCYEDAYDIFLGCDNSIVLGWHDMSDTDF